MNGIIAWPEGNDVVLSVKLTQQTDEGMEDVNLDAIDGRPDVRVLLGNQTDCHCPFTITHPNIINIECNESMRAGSYAVVISIKMNGVDMRSYEPAGFRIVKYNEQANVDFDEHQGAQTATMSMTFCLKPQVVVEGRNSYQIWLDEGNEGSLQDFIDGLIETHSITPTVIEQVVQADIIGEDNYVYHYQNGRYVKTDIYCKGDKGDNLTWDDLTDEQKREIAGVRQEVIPALKNQVLSELCKGTLSGEITLEEGVTTIDTYRFQRTNIEKLILPEGVTTISTCAFAACQQLVEVDFPSTLSSILDRAFQDCHLLEIILPLNLSTCHIAAFVPNNYLEYMAVPPGYSAQLFVNFDAVGSSVFKTFVYTGPNVFLYGYTRVTKGLVLLYNGVSHIVGIMGNVSNVLIYVPDELYDAYQNTDDTSWTAAYRQRIRKLSTYTYEGGLDFIRRVKEKYGMTD